MNETAYDLHRTHYCGELRPENQGQKVVLKGWVDRRRDLGGLIFVDLRDRSGKTQVLFNPEFDSGLHNKAEALRSEYVIAVCGTVQKRLEANRELATGEIEVAVSELRILNTADTPPVAVNEDNAETEDIRLKYRFLDLRRPAIQRHILFRHQVMQASRQLLSRFGFVEVETPILMKSTPEGARDFLVPSRMNRGKFYALPQSPQTYKQILMVAGYDRYFQIAKCFRDEDLRADRQPEFTQIDCELSFVSCTGVFNVFDRFLQQLFQEVMQITIGTIPRMSYQDAMERYGSDKPDLRFGMDLHTLNPLFETTGFKIFRSVLDAKGILKGLKAPGAAKFSRKTMDDLADFIKPWGAKGLVWLKVTDKGLEGPSAKFLDASEKNGLRKALEAEPGDVLFIVADCPKTANASMGRLRLELGRRLGLIDESQFSFVWITDFPMFEYSDTDKRWTPMHHPFTAPLDEDVSLLYGPDYHLARAKAYDIVLNGNEIGGGSIRIHDRHLQGKVFELLGISAEEAQSKFGFLLEAFKYGAPPHGGIAFGLDRLLMLMLGLDSIRDVIPFPKTTTGASLMDNAPSKVIPEQLAELGLALK